MFVSVSADPASRLEDGASVTRSVPSLEVEKRGRVLQQVSGVLGCRKEQMCTMKGIEGL